MSTAGDVLSSLAMAAAKEAIQWAVDKLRAKAKEAGIEIDQNAAVVMIEAQLAAVYVAAQVMSMSIDADYAKLKAAEAKLRGSSNVTVVDSMDEASEMVPIDSMDDEATK